MPGDAGRRNTATRADAAAASGPARHDPDATAPSGRRLSVVVAGPVSSGLGTRYALDRPSLLVGRAPDSDLVLDETTVSARHARIDVEADGAYLTDLGSTNGTWMGERRVTGSVELTVGTEISLGRCVLRVEAGGGPPAGDGNAADAANELFAVDDPQPARSGTIIPARHRRRLLVSFDPDDSAIGLRIVERLERIGHTVLVERSGSVDGWEGRLLDAVWSCDGVVFVVSQAAAASERVHREVHLAGAERTTVIPVLVDDVELPDDLAFYLERQAVVDLRRDPAAGLSELQRRLDALPAKRVARPWQLVRRVVLAALVAAVVITLFLLVTG